MGFFLAETDVSPPSHLTLPTSCHGTKRCYVLAFVHGEMLLEILCIKTKSIFIHTDTRDFISRLGPWDPRLLAASL